MGASPAARELLDVAIDAARSAGAVLAERFGGQRTIEHKGRIDLVTDADKAAEAAALGEIRRRFPDHAILAEESGASGRSKYVWIVDPLDGTNNYAHGVPHFCVSVACEVDGVLEAGVIFEPLRDELFCATRGGGATLNASAIHPTAVHEVHGALLATGMPYWVHERPEPVMGLLDAFVRRAQGIRRFGSAALDLAWVACGRYDGFFELGLKPWDIAAGMLIVHEAGGVVTSMSGGEVDMTDGAVLAAGAELHPLLVPIARSAS